MGKIISTLCNQNNDNTQNSDNTNTKVNDIIDKSQNEETKNTTKNISNKQFDEKIENKIKKIEQNQNKLSINDFLFHAWLGKGTFGKVAQVNKKDNKKFYALKILKKKDFNVLSTKENAITEKNILKDSYHPFIVRLRYSFQDHDALYYCMDYVPGGELFKYLGRYKKFSESVARFYAAEVLLAQEYLHVELDTIYRDLKPENILLDENGHIKLTDFGLSKMGVVRANSFCGTPQYQAPEILDRKGHTKMVDYWTLGCQIYEMLNGYPPYDHNNQSILFTLTTIGD